MHYILAILIFFFVQISSAAPLKNIVVFGDSLSDMGNLYEYMHHQLPQSPPYYTGRFSNGPIWVEYLMKNYFENPESHVSNYAFGGAGILENESTSEDDDDFFTLKREIDTYLLAHADKADPKSLFVIWIGGNNYLGVPPDVDVSTTTVMNGIEAGLERLVRAGGQHFVLINLPDLDKTPLATELEASKELKQLSTSHNHKLQQLLRKEQRKHRSIQFVQFDANQYFRLVLEHGRDYGVSNLTDSCNKTYFQEANPSALNLLSSAQPQGTSPPRLNCADYFFFDLIHPTTRVHELTASFMYDFFTQEGITFRA